MTDLFFNLWNGLAVAGTPINLGYCLLGVLLGTLVGVLPGVGPVPTMAMLLPLTFGLPPESALIMLAGIFYGAQYGGSTSAILVNVPGESSSVVTAIDGYQMSLKGRAGAALAIAAIGSFFAGCVATVFIAAFGPALASVALDFGPTEYFALMVLGLVMSIVMARGSLLKAFGMMFVGLILGLVGRDTYTGLDRFTFGLPALSDGISFTIVAVGFFALCEIITTIQQSDPANDRQEARSIGRLWPTASEFRRSRAPIVRGTLCGSILGVLPGGGTILASFASYIMEKKLSKTPQEFGHGAIEGVAGPESANNAGAQTSFIPLLTLGIPSNSVMALMVGAMIIHGIQPGPQFISEQPTLFWGIVASMWIGNVFLIVLNLPMLRIWVKLLSVPHRLLFPAILIFCAIGLFGTSNSSFDVLLAAVFAVAGFVLTRLECEPAPLILGFIVGPMMEENLRRSMLLARGDALALVTSPVSAALLLVATALLVAALMPKLGRARDVAFEE